MLQITYLREEHRNGFDNYKYNCVDTSFLSQNIMHPFWNFCVKFFPRWIAPNLITFTGFLLTVANFPLIGYYDFNFDAANNHTTEVIPRWVWIVASVNIFLAYTLDGIDGKQARRTGTSSPLGELFDHGVDSYSAALIPIFMFSIFGSNELSPIRVLYLPHAYDFTMWGVTIVLMITGIEGIAFWRNILPPGYSAAFVFEMILYVSGILTSHPFIIYRIIMSYRKRTGKMRPFIEAIRPLIPFVSLFIITTIWVLFSKNSIAQKEPRLYLLLLGTIFSNISCRLIVAQMSNVKCDAWNHLIWMVLIVTGFSVAPFNKIGLPTLSSDAEQVLLYFLISVATLTHVHYGYSVICEMCDHFKIRCFKVPPPQPQTINI